MTHIKRRDFLKTAAGVAMVPLPIGDLINAFFVHSRPVVSHKVFDQIPAATTINPDDIMRALSRPTVAITLDQTAHPDQTIKPGQPLSFRWGVYDWAPFGTGVGGGAGLNESTRYGSALATISFNGNQVFGPSRTRTSRIFMNDHGEDLARSFFTIGSENELTIEVTGLPNGDVINGTTTVIVVADNAPSWEWTTPSTITGWKDRYTLSGNLHNNAEFASMHMVPVLHLAAPAGNPYIAEQDHPLTDNREVVVPHSSATSLASAEFTQDWVWFDQFLLIQNGSLTREFPYTVRFSAVDEFRNSYGNLTSDQLAMSISVAVEKRLEFATASAGQIAAVAVAALALAALAGVYTIATAPFLFAIAGGLESGARLAQAAANDPPAPDQNFMESLNPSLTSLPDKAAEPAAFNNLLLFVALAKRILESRLGLYQIEGRLLGARDAKSTEGLDLQTADYAKLLYSMITDTAALLKLQPDLLRWVNADSGFDAKTIQNGLDTLQKGISSDARDQMTKAGISKDDQAAIEKAASNQDILKQATEVGPLLDTIIKSLAQVTVIVRDKAPGVLSPYSAELDVKKDDNKGLVDQKVK